jgi:hypothetical protein
MMYLDVFTGFVTASINIHEGMLNFFAILPIIFSGGHSANISADVPSNNLADVQANNPADVPTGVLYDVTLRSGARGEGMAARGS